MAALVAATVLSLLLVNMQAGSAQAVGFTAYVWWPNLHQGQISLLGPGNALCPSASAGETPSVKATLVDSSSTSYEIMNGLYDASEGFASEQFTIPAGAATGAATITPRCVKQTSGGEVVTLTYDPINVTISSAAQADVAISSTNWKDRARLSGTCPAGSRSAEINLVSESFYENTPNGSYFNTWLWEFASVNSSGQWWYDFSMTPGSAGSTSFQTANETYTVHIMCSGTGFNTFVDPLRFTTGNARYVALGDSYSSGEGAFNYDIDSGSCHRSSDAYSFYVADALSLGRPLLAACSGAQTYNIALGSSPQRDKLSMDTEYVTVTIGGNDVGFAEVLEFCVDTLIHAGYGCEYDSYLPNAVNDRLDGLEGTASSPVYTNGVLVKSITQVILEIEEYAPNAKIFMGGYPRLFGDDTSNYSMASGVPGGYKCMLVPGLASVSYDDAQWMNSLADELNGVIEGEVASAKLLGVNVEFVDALFGGHGLCDDNDPWLNAVVLDGNTPPGHLPESMHPLADGHTFGYGIGFEAVMSQ